MASTPSSPSATTAGSAAGLTYWSGLTSVAADDGDVTILDAKPLVDDTIADAAVFAGRSGIDGSNGLTHSTPPRESGITGEPVPAKGAVIGTDPPWVLYVRGTLRDGASAGGIYGAKLRVRDSHGEESTMSVMSPAFLCADDMTASPGGAPTLSAQCQNAEGAFRSNVEELFGAAL